MPTYIDVVNSALLESGIDLDEIDVADFPNPVDPMHVRFKRWAQAAWRDIQQERNEWQFRTKMAQRIISPRFLVVDGDRATPPPLGSEYVGDESGATFKVIAVQTLSGSWSGSDAEAWIDFQDYNDASIGNYAYAKWNEYWDETAPSALNINVFKTKWWGRYDLIGDLTDCLEPDLNTFYIQSTGGSTVQDNDGGADNRWIVYTPYDSWVYTQESDQVGRGRPTMFTITPEGFYDFYPRPDQQYLLTFQYSVKPQELVNATDQVAVLADNYSDVILWRTVMYYADYDDKPQLFARAERRYQTYKNRMETNLMPKPYWAASKYTYFKY